MEWMNTVEILQAFGIDADKGGGADFVELVYTMIGRYWWQGEDIVVGHIVNDMCKAKNTFPRFYYGKIKKAIAPLLDSDEETLSALGIFPEKRTSGMMAKAMAEREIKEMERNGKRRKTKPDHERMGRSSGAVRGKNCSTANYQGAAGSGVHSGAPPQHVRPIRRRKK